MNYEQLVKDLRDTEMVCRDRMDGQVMLDAASAIEWLQAKISELGESYSANLVAAQNAQPQWVRVEDELPDDTRDVLAVRRYGNDLEKQEVIVAHLSVIMDMKRGYDKWWSATNITHWMPFPEPPKEDA